MIAFNGTRTASGCHGDNVLTISEKAVGEQWQENRSPAFVPLHPNSSHDDDDDDSSPLPDNCCYFLAIVVA